MIKTRETFHFNPPISIEGSWMIGLKDLEVYNSIFNITEEINKFELFKFPDEKAGGVSFEKVRVDIERDLYISDITDADLQDDIKSPINIKEYREQVKKRMKDDKYMLNLKLILCFKISKVFLEQKLIWLKMILDWFWMNINPVLLLMN